MIYRLSHFLLMRPLLNDFYLSLIMSSLLFPTFFTFCHVFLDLNDVPCSFHYYNLFIIGSDKLSILFFQSYFSFQYISAFVCANVRCEFCNVKMDCVIIAMRDRGNARQTRIKAPRLLGC